MKIKKLLITTAVALMAAHAGQAAENGYTLVENFDDGNNADLSEYSPFGPFGAPATYTYADGALTITAPRSPAPQISDQVIGLYVGQPHLTDGTISIDLWNWETATMPVFFLNGRSTEGAPGTYNFYSVNFDPVPFPNASGEFRKTPGMSILRWVNNRPTLPALATIDMSDVALDLAQRDRWEHRGGGQRRGYGHIAGDRRGAAFPPARSRTIKIHSGE